MCVTCNGTGRIYKQSFAGVTEILPCSCPEAEIIREIKKAEYQAWRKEFDRLYEEYCNGLGVGKLYDQATI